MRPEPPSPSIDDAAREAERIAAVVRDDPARRLKLAADAYAGGPTRRGCHRPYQRAVVSFMRKQLERGVLNALHSEQPGSPWWRAVNEGLLRDTYEARLLAGGMPGTASRASVERWVEFFEAPSAPAWYLAHNTSIVAGYLEHRDLAAGEAPAERFFMDVALLRVLYAHALVSASTLALGRLGFVSRVLGHPRARTVSAFLWLSRVLPDEYPLDGVSIERVLANQHRVGRMLDFAVIGIRLDELYAFSAKVLDEHRLLDLVRDGAPVYAWPYEERHVWVTPVPGRIDRLVSMVTSTPLAGAWGGVARMAHGLGDSPSAHGPAGEPRRARVVRATSRGARIPLGLGQRPHRLAE